MPTLNLQVGASTDDAYESSTGTMYLNSTNHTTEGARLDIEYTAPAQQASRSMHQFRMRRT